MSLKKPTKTKRKPKKTPSKTQTKAPKKTQRKATAKTTQAISTEMAPPPVGAYPHARRFGELLFLSGVGPRAAKGAEIPGVHLSGKGEVISYDIEIETESVIRNVKTILASCGSSLEQVLDVQVFLTNMKKDFPTFNRVYAKHFAQVGATRTTIQVGALPTPIHVEFKVIAFVKTKP